MKIIKITNVIILFIILAMSPAAHAQSKSMGNINVLLGQRNLEENDWKPVHEQALLGVEADFKGKNWPVSLLLGFSGSKEDDNAILINGFNVSNAKLEGSTREFFVGARKYFFPGDGLMPYLNGGISFIKAKIAGSIAGFGLSGDDSSTGLFFGGGAIYRFGSFNIGFDLRLLTGSDLTIGAVSATADYSQFALIVGYGW